jgi:hypothetical protein
VKNVAGTCFLVALACLGTDAMLAEGAPGTPAATPKKAAAIGSAGAGSGSGSASGSGSIDADCSYHVVSAIDSLIASAEKGSMLSVATSTPPLGSAASDSCAAQIVGRHLILKAGNNTLETDVMASDGREHSAATLAFTTAVPPDAVASTVWQLTDTKGQKYGSLQLAVTKLTVKQLAVAARDDNDNNQNAQVVRVPATDGSLIAAARVPLGSAADCDDDVDDDQGSGSAAGSGSAVNLCAAWKAGSAAGSAGTASARSLALSAPGPAPTGSDRSARAADIGPSDITNAIQVDVPTYIAEPQQGYFWTVTSSTWGTSAWFHCRTRISASVAGWLAPGGGSGRSGGSGDDACEIRPDRILVAVKRALSSPLVATLELHNTSARATVYARVSLQLATSAAVAAIPIPLWQVAHVSCETHRVWLNPILSTAFQNGHIAIDSDAVDEGKCHVILDYDYNDLGCVQPRSGVKVPKEQRCQAPVLSTAKQHREHDAKKQRWKTQANLGGPQGVEITVTHGSSTATCDLLVDPKQGLDIPLPVPTTTAGTAPTDADEYLVNIKLKSTGQVSYLEKTLDDTATANPQTNVSMHLRARGAGSTWLPIRIGVTFPVTPISLRWPPSASSVTSSTSSTRVGIDTSRVSAMAFLEPWDDDRDRNPLPIPLQLQAGVSVLQLSSSNPVDLNALFGVVAELPIAGSGASATSVSVGLFYEWGLQEASNAIVATFSIDLFQPATTSGLK